MYRYFLTISYDGSDFNGWQVQENTPHTVQQVLQEKLSMLFREQTSVTGCGRTDTGVHARNYVAHTDTGTDLHTDLDYWIYRINKVLPSSVALQDIRLVRADSHARFAALERSYVYYLSKRRNPFRDRYSWLVYGELDFDLMNAAAELLYGKHDFTSFSKHHTQNKTNLCTVNRALWRKSGEHEYRFSISADRFLRGMVRAVVGTLVLVGRGKMSIEEFKAVVDARNRAVAGENAPAHALFFTGARYPADIYL